MLRIDLDFASHKTPTAGMLLLLLGVLALIAALGVNYFYWQPRLDAGASALREARATLQRQRPAVAKISDAQLAAEWGRAMVVAGELNRPWEKLFALLESEAESPVAILSLEPDAVKGDLVLSCEARDFEAMLAYYRMLQQQENLSAVALHTHQVNQQDKDKPIRFRITAKWGTKS